MPSWRVCTDCKGQYGWLLVSSDSKERYRCKDCARNKREEDLRKIEREREQASEAWHTRRKERLDAEIDGLIKKKELAELEIQRVREEEETKRQNLKKDADLRIKQLETEQEMEVEKVKCALDTEFRKAELEIETKRMKDAQEAEKQLKQLEADKRKVEVDAEFQKMQHEARRLEKEAEKDLKQMQLAADKEKHLRQIEADKETHLRQIEADKEKLEMEHKAKARSDDIKLQVAKESTMQARIESEERTKQIEAEERTKQMQEENIKLGHIDSMLKTLAEAKASETLVQSVLKSVLGDAFASEIIDVKFPSAQNQAKFLEREQPLKPVNRHGSRPRVFTAPKH